MNTAHRRLRLSFYGDDFTGSTDVMEALATNGVRTILFREPPSLAELEEYDNLAAVGVAGVGRSMTTGQMEAELPDIFRRMSLLGAEIFHYKTCSTFDSSPQTGSIGRAIEIGARVFKSGTIPLVVGAPILKRYCVFGNLFATVRDATYRLDRHPTMRRHPATWSALLRRSIEARSP